jgi:uncharacterized protein
MRRRFSLLLVMSLVASTLPFLALAPAIADSDAQVVISQVYGGGGNTGAPYTHDFVELFNRSGAPVSLAGRSIQYASATGTGNFGASSTQLTELPAVTLQPGQYYLVQQAGGSTGEPLPTPDLVDPSPIAMAAGAGKVALVEGTTTLGCNGGSTPCSAEQLARIVDLVGYGNANFFEGSGAAPTLSNTTAALRLEDGAQDTDDNAADFVAGTPAPRNSSHGQDPGPGDGTPVTVSQVYGGGGNSGATYTHDFIELYNRSDEPVSLDGWSVQYASAAGTSWQVTPLAGTLEPDTHYLIQQAAGTGGTTPLPTPDATGSTAMAATNGKVALVSATTALSGSCPVGGGSVVDFVGFGSTANCFEGSGPTPTLSNTTAALRLDDGAQDTDDNAADFVVGDPTPRNTGGDGGGEDPEPVDVCEVDEDDLTAINEIQGDGDATPIPGQAVVTRGVVTADFTSGGASGLPQNQGLRGFFIEAIAVDRDDDPQTSEGVFVFDGGGVFDGQIGDLVHVAGTAGEFSGVTQVSASDLAVCADTGVDTELPPPVELPLPADPFDRGELFEPYESMRVTHSELTVVEFFQLERFGEVRLSSGGVLDNPTNVVDPHDDEAYEEIVLFNRANTIILDDGRTGQNLDRLGADVDPLPYVEPGDTLRVGDQLRDHAAILHFGFGEWRLQPIDIDAITQEFQDNRTRPRPESPPKVGGTMTVASFNVLNYFNGDGYFVGDATAAGFPTSRGAVTPSEFERQTAKIVDAIVRMDADIVGLIEIENNEYAAVADLVEGLNDALGAGTYAYIDTGYIGTDAIKLALIYKLASASPVGDYAILDSTVDARFRDNLNRPVLAQTFIDNSTGGIVTVAVNHLKSKGSDCNAVGDPDIGDGSGNCNLTRTLAAQALVDWLASDPTGSGDDDFLIIGDLNAYDKEDPIDAVRAGPDDILGTYDDYTDLVYVYQGEEAYSYVFDGQTGYLDHALASAGLLDEVSGATVWHINADEPDLIDYDTSFKQDAQDAIYAPDPYRSSDHDPVIVGLDLCDEIAPTLQVTVTPDVLWPPNHRYVEVLATVIASDNFDPNPTVTLVSVTSNEPDNGEDDGNTINDIVILDNFNFLLRAERSGSGTGRIYTITYLVTDACGNETTQSVMVLVPLELDS